MSGLSAMETAQMNRQIREQLEEIDRLKSELAGSENNRLAMGEALDSLQGRLTNAERQRHTAYKLLSRIAERIKMDGHAAWHCSGDWCVLLKEIEAQL